MEGRAPLHIISELWIPLTCSAGHSNPPFVQYPWPAADPSLVSGNALSLESEPMLNSNPWLKVLDDPLLLSTLRGEVLELHVS